MLLAVPFLLLVAIALPLLAWVAYRQARNTVPAKAPELDVRAMVLQIAIVQSVVLGFACLAVYGSGHNPVWVSRLSVGILTAALVGLGAVLLLSLLEARRPLGRDDPLRAGLRKISARNPAWLGVTVYAGFVEEFAYRGVLTLILGHYIGYLPAAAVSAGLFGLGHLSSGWRGFGFALLFALAMQWLVYLSGGLLLAVAVHAVYDILAAVLGHRIERRRIEDTAPSGPLD